MVSFREQHSSNQKCNLFYSYLHVFFNVLYHTCLILAKVLGRVVRKPVNVNPGLNVQEYPTEPLDKIPALQGRIALAGKIEHWPHALAGKFI